MSTCGVHASGRGREEHIESLDEEEGDLRGLKSHSLCHIPVPADCLVVLEGWNNDSRSEQV